MSGALRRLAPRTIMTQITSLVAIASLLGVAITGAIIHLSARASSGGARGVVVIDAGRVSVVRPADAAASAVPGTVSAQVASRPPRMPLTRRLWRTFVLVPATFVASVVGIFVVLLSAYGARWITRPLSSIAAAADSFGRSPAAGIELSERGAREIVAVAGALNRMQRRIRSLLDERTRMLSAISHDIRTPLTRLRLRADRLPNVEDREGVLREISRIDEMLTETLEYLRAEASGDTPEPADLPSLLQTICEDFADVGASVAYEGPGRLAYSCRPRMLARAVTNLVENSVKHAPDVRVTLRPRTDGSVEIDVQDNGPGIHAADRERVFEPFFIVDRSRGALGRGGFGLGLAMARTVIEGHGGRIGLFDRPPHGLVVRIHLPRGGPNRATLLAHRT